MELRELDDKSAWEEFSLSTSPNNFLQSYNWGKFNQEIGKKIIRLGIYNQNNLIGIVLVLIQTTKLGNLLYVPRGPIVREFSSEILDSLVKKLRQIAQENDCFFIKIEPSLAEAPENQAIFSKLGFVRSVTFTQVEDAWLLDLTKSEEELLMDMRKTTRYLVRNEPKQGVTVEISDQASDAEKFVDLLFQTAGRKQFTNHSKDYYLKQFEILSKDNEMRIFKAIKGGEILAMAMISFYGNTASYLHGASKQTSDSVGYSLQWQAILEAKNRGLKYYNFWGVVKDKNFTPGHPWYGFSLFKRGFGGYKYSYLRAQDLALSPKYQIYRLAEKTRRLKSRLQTGYWED